MARRKLVYVERKSAGHRGPAWIGYALLSKTGVTVYINGRALQRARGGGIRGNHFCVETGDEYWVSGPKQGGGDRHWAGGGVVSVEARALPEYLELRGIARLPSGYEVVSDFADTDPAAFYDLKNRPMSDSLLARYLGREGFA